MSVMIRRRGATRRRRLLSGITCVLGALGTLGCGTAPRPRQHDVVAQPRSYERGDVELVSGAGVTAGPSMFLLSGEVDYHLDSDNTIGPMLQLGVSDDDTFVGASFHYKRHFLLDQSSDLWRVRPFAQAGLGLAYLDKGNRDDWSLLTHVGGGVQYDIDSDIHLGSSIVLDFLPNGPAGDSFIFTWQVVQIGFDF